MKSTDVLRNEHVYIKKVLAGIRKQCILIVNGEKVNLVLFAQIIDFVRNYADKYHHQKEENHLFNVMSEQLAKDIGTGPILGMLSEHDFGRAFIYELEQALRRYENGDLDARVDIIGNAIAYEQMLLKHIDKEDNAIFNLAERSLSHDIFRKLDKDFEDIEAVTENEKIRNKYIEFANTL